MNSKNAIFASQPDLALSRYLETGYHVEPGVWSAESCRELIEASHRLPSYVQGSRRSVMNPHGDDPLFLKALAHPTIKAILEKMVKGPVSGLQTQFFFGPPGTHGFAMHQDNSYVQANPDVFVSAWSAMEAIGPENGGLAVYPGTHKLPILPMRELAPVEGLVHDPNSNNAEVVLPPGYEPLHLSVKRGDVVFIHGNLVHASNQNRTKDRTRHVLLCTYIRSGEAFRPGNYAKRAEIRL